MMIRNVLLYVFFGVLVALLFELLFIGYYYVVDGEYLTVNEKLNSEDNNYLKAITGELECDYTATLIQHPYFGFTHNSNPPCNDPKINKAGFYGPDYPVKKNRDVYTLMILGGSVAALLGQASVDSLEDKLNRRYRKDGKRFVVMNAAIEAWKQPQQVIALLLYGDLADGVISIEGYNELIMSIGHGYKQGLEKPWFENYLAVNPENVNSTYLVYMWLNSKIIAATKTSTVLRNSKFLYFVTRTLRVIIRGKAQALPDTQAKNQTINNLFSVPEEWTYEESKQHYFESYKSYLRTFDAIANGKNLDRAVFIQPVPAIDKPLSKDELEVVGNLFYKDEYLEQEDQLLSLVDAGIPVFSMTSLYKDVPDTLYVDPVHHSLDSVGHEMMADKIIATIAKEWGFDRIQ